MARSGSHLDSRLRQARDNLFQAEFDTKAGIVAIGISAIVSFAFYEMVLGGMRILWFIVAYWDIVIFGQTVMFAFSIRKYRNMYELESMRSIHDN